MLNVTTVPDNPAEKDFIPVLIHIGERCEDNGNDTYGDAETYYTLGVNRNEDVQIKVAPETLKRWQATQQLYDATQLEMKRAADPEALA